MSRRLVAMVLWSGLVMLLLQVEGMSDTPRRPPPMDVDGGPGAPEPLAAASERDPSLRIRDDDADTGICTGTAFAIDDQGHWLTAHHVVEGCRQLAILTAPRHGVRVTEMASHPQADVTLLASGPSAPALRLSAQPLFRGEDGFHVGYPHGEAGDVHGALMGRVNLRRRRTIEPGVLWAEIERSPDDDRSLGGLSGSPVVDHTGNVIGVSIAASPRRGRVVSAPPESLRELMARAALVPPAAMTGDDAELVGANYAAFGRGLRQRFTVAKVLCWDRETPARRPPLRWR